MSGAGTPLSLVLDERTRALSLGKAGRCLFSLFSQAERAQEPRAEARASPSSSLAGEVQERLVLSQDEERAAPAGRRFLPSRVTRGGLGMGPGPAQASQSLANDGWVQSN